jgi:2-oxoglutarate dehydrogenase E1 component
MKNKIKGEIEKAYVASKNHQFNIEEWTNEEWESIKETSKYGKMKDTGVSVSVLKDLGEKISTLPEDQEFHPAIKKIFDARLKSITEGIDWGTGEALAFASLIQEGFHVRVSGQDVERGTFSHRHAVVFNQNKDTSYIPINTVVPNAEIKRF